MSGLILRYRNHVPRIAADAFIAPTATVIGDVEIGARSNVWFGVVIRGDVHEIRIGAGTNIQDGTVVHCTRNTHPTWIGSNVTIGHSAVIHGCRLEDRAFVGMTACVMDGAVVESDAMVAAGALVTPGKRVRTGELWAGSPAKLLRALTPEEIAQFAQTAPRYAELGAEYREADGSVTAGGGSK